MQALGMAAFDVHTPCPEDVPHHIAHAMSLGLPEADSAPIRHLTVLGNGPSAKGAPLGHPTLALNGAIKLFFNTGYVPTYWAACDPQRDVILDCLDMPLSPYTKYLVASKCHPDVFKRLEGYDVRLWHIDDYPAPPPARNVPTGSSIMLPVLALMRRLGYRAFDIWGWDACYINGEHHATPHEPLNPEYDCEVTIGAEQRVIPQKVTKRQLEVYRNMREKAARFGYNLPEMPLQQDFVGGKVFQTTRSWTVETQEALNMLQYVDYEVTIHGDGMIKALKESGARIV